MRRSITYFTAAATFVTVCLYGLAHFVMDADRTRFLEERALLVARTVAWVAGQELGTGQDGLTDRFVDAADEVLPDLEGALVLKRTRYLAHLDPDRRGARLDRDSLIDKALFDAAKAVKADLRRNLDEREKDPALGRDPFPAAEIAQDEGVFSARVAVTLGGDFEALAEVRLSAPPPPAPFPLVVGLIGLVAVGAFVPVGWRLRARTTELLAGAALLSVATVLQVEQLHGWRAELLQDRETRLAELAAELGARGPAAWQARAQAEPLVDAMSLARDGFATGRFLRVASATVAASSGGGDDLEVDAAGVRVAVSRAHLDRRSAQHAATLDRWATAIGLLGLVVFVLGLYGQLDRFGRALHAHRSAYAYMSPAMLGLLVLVFIPVSYGLALGFQSRVYNSYEFVGFANYIEILGSADLSDPRSFWFTLGVTVMWTVSNVVLHVSIGLFLALLLNDHMLKAKGIYRVILVVPWAIPNYVTALIWKSMFHKQFGAVNAFLETIGLESMSWFQTFWPAFTANVTTNTWLGFPFMMVVSLGALQSIPTDLYEAARVDGASRWQRFSGITLPLLMPALVPAVIVGTVWTFNMFNIIYLVSGGAPNGGTDILITEAYRWAFEADRKGFAAAYSTVIFLILLAFTLVTNRITGATKGAFE